jgi:CRP-like cAMP-binding protein
MGMETQENLPKVPPFSQPFVEGSESNTIDKISKEDLATIPCFSQLSDMEREKVASVTTKKQFSKDDLVFNKNDSGGQLFFVHQGEVKISRVIREHQAQTLSVVKPGDFFGVVSFIDGKERSVSAVCNADSVVFIIDKTGFDELSRQDPATGLKILKIFSPIICSYLRKTNSKIKDLDNYVTSRS